MSAMKEKALTVLAIALAGVVGALALGLLFNARPAMDLQERVATWEELARTNALSASALETVTIEGTFQKFGGASGGAQGAWPRFRGPNFDNISAENVALAEKWPENGPAVLWSVALGDGYAGPAVLNGRVYLLDYDESEKSDALRCFSLDSGEEIWRRSYKVHVKRNHGMSRTVPAVTEKYVVTMGPRCHVMCVDAETGAFRWGLDLVKDFGAKEPMWYTGQCPLIDDGVAVIAPGGKALMVGVDCETGNILWQTPNPRVWEMSHSSVMPATFKGRKMYVYCAIGGVAGVAADGADRGAILWESAEWNSSVVAPSPVVMDDGLIFLTAGYGTGSAVCQLVEANGGFSAKPLRRLDRKVFACEQHTPIFYKGCLFSVMPPDAGSAKEQAACMTPSGEIKWASGKTERFGLGPFLIADDKMFILSDDGLLTMIKASSDGYAKLAQAQVLSEHEAWAPMAIAGGKLLLRDTKRMVCLDIKAK